MLLSLRPSTKVLQRTFSQLATSSRGLVPDDFVLLSDFFDPHEQRILLTTALHKLDSQESRRIRKLQKEYRANNPVPHSAPLESIFLPERCYSVYHLMGATNHLQGHYDNVIRDYREMHLTSWTESEIPGLTLILNRLRALYPSRHTQTHLLHLSSTGEILPHIDNISASGVWIVGASLGATRMLKMEATDGTIHRSFETLLPSGSVYLQRDDVRYNWKHSIVHPQEQGEVKRGQRVSIMVRVGQDVHLLWFLLIYGQDCKEEGCPVKS
ncbi:hypothetical protein F5I97DRAFT_1802403 [Phlebopus sp. FC_14]|nr:hypothetical protein F5I97DRAFT_1802403 [Phlebopus sp. FC_14]